MNVRWNQILDLGLDDNFRIEGRNLARCGNGFGQRLGSIALFEQRLPLQVAGLDVVAIDNSQRSHASSSQQGRQRRPGRSTPYNRDSASREPAMAHRSNAAV